MTSAPAETLVSRLGWAALSGALVTVQRFGTEYQKGRLTKAYVVGHLTAMALLCYVSILIADHYDFDRARTAVTTMIMCTLGVPNIERMIRSLVFQHFGIKPPPESGPVNVLTSCDETVCVPSTTTSPVAVQAVGPETAQSVSALTKAKMADMPPLPPTGDMIMTLGKLDRAERARGGDDA